MRTKRNVKKLEDGVLAVIHAKKGDLELEDHSCCGYSIRRWGEDLPEPVLAITAMNFFEMADETTSDRKLVAKLKRKAEEEQGYEW
jgi:hypothetical protein